MVSLKHHPIENDFTRVGPRCDTEKGMGLEFLNQRQVSPVNIIKGSRRHELGEAEDIAHRYQILGARHLVGPYRVPALVSG